MGNYILDWLNRAIPERGCAAQVEVPLIRDDDEGPIPHSFPCTKPTGHDGFHRAEVEWGDPDE